MSGTIKSQTVVIDGAVNAIPITFTTVDNRGSATVLQRLDTHADYNGYSYRICTNLVYGVHETRCTTNYDLIDDGFVVIANAPFSNNFEASFESKVLWIKCGCPPVEPFGVNCFDEEVLREILFASKWSGIPLGEWSEIHALVQRFNGPHKSGEVSIVSYNGFRLWSTPLHHPERPSPWEYSWTHEVSMPNGTVTVPPFLDRIPVSQYTLMVWVDLGYPPPEPFGVICFRQTFIRRLAKIAREHNVPKGSWDELATIERLTR